MKMRTTTIIAAAVAVLLTILSMPAQAVIEDPAIADTIMIDSVVTFTNEVSVIPIRFFNDEDLAGIEVTLTWDSPDIQIDSFSFVGSRVEYISIRGTFSRPDFFSIYCFPIGSEPMIAPDTGLLGNLHFSWDIGITPQLVKIDTITVLDNEVVYSTTFSDFEANAFQPEFQAGYIDIQQAFGCCIERRGNVDNANGEEPNVADLTYLISYLFTGGPPADCPEEANVDGANGLEPNVADITYLVSYLFQGGPEPPLCNP